MDIKIYKFIHLTPSILLQNIIYTYYKIHLNLFGKEYLYKKPLHKEVTHLIINTT